jgi:hypothetical protein
MSIAGLHGEESPARSVAMNSRRPNVSSADKIRLRHWVQRLGFVTTMPAPVDPPFDLAERYRRVKYSERLLERLTLTGHRDHDCREASTWTAPKPRGSTQTRHLALC